MRLKICSPLLHKRTHTLCSMKLSFHVLLIAKCKRNLRNRTHLQASQLHFVVLHSHRDAAMSLFVKCRPCYYHSLDVMIRFYESKIWWTNRNDTGDKVKNFPNFVFQLPLNHTREDHINPNLITFSFYRARTASTIGRWVPVLVERILIVTSTVTISTAIITFGDDFTTAP